MGCVLLVEISISTLDRWRDYLSLPLSQAFFANSYGKTNNLDDYQCGEA